MRSGSFPCIPVLCALVGTAAFLIVRHPVSRTLLSGVQLLKAAGLVAAFLLSEALLLYVSRNLFAGLCSRRVMKVKGLILWRMAECAASLALCSVFLLCRPEDAASLMAETAAVSAAMFLVFDVAAALVAKHIQRKEETGLMTLASTTAGGSGVRLSDRTVDFTDDSGSGGFSVDSGSVLYVKSEGNYIGIHYESGEGVKTRLVRMTLSAAEASLRGTPLVRCQRSYIVNTRRIRMMQNDARAAFIIIDDDGDSVIPLSQNCVGQITAATVSQS